MATKVVALRFRIGLRPNSHADHPPFTSLPMAIAINGKEVDREGLIRSHQFQSWIYDKLCGHADNADAIPCRPASPRGYQYGMMLVDRELADECLANLDPKFECHEMIETDAKAFWEVCGHAHLPDVKRDTAALQALKAERDLLVDVGQDTAAIDAKIKAALDPENPEPGVRKPSYQKNWADAKRSMDFTL